MPRAIEHIVAQHASDAAFLWVRRQHILSAPHYRLKDLVAFDDRLQANLDGLQLAGDLGWELCAAQLSDDGGAGEVFVAAVLALEQRSPERLGGLLLRVDEEPALVAALTSALGWVPGATALAAAQELLRAVIPVRRRVGIAAYAIHRSDPGRALASALEDEAPTVRARALRAVGELGRRDLLPYLNLFLREKDDSCRFWAAASAVLLGDRANSLEILDAFCTVLGPFQMRALQLALRAGDLGRARRVVERLRNDVAQLRAAVQAVGICGDCAELPWLLKQAEMPQWSRVAGEAFSLVTGLDLELEGLTTHPSQSEPTRAVEAEEDVLELDPDEHLPLPEPEKLHHWYQEHKSRFAKDARCFLGIPPSIDNCTRVLRSGTQRQRIAASIYLSLLGCKSVLHEWRAPAWRQEGG